jgi:acetyl-CoA C-acetyltransferase
MSSIVIVGGVRTAIGKFQGSLQNYTSTELGALVLAEVAQRTHVPVSEIEEVIMGCCVQIGQESGLVARGAALMAGLPVTSTALGVNRQCSSGLQAILTAYMEIKCGFASVVAAGGTEVMSRFPYLLPRMRDGYRMGNGTVVDLLTDSLYDPIAEISMGMTAENIARQYHLTREELDLYALESHRRATNAIQQGLFDDEILPLLLKDKKGERWFATDENVRQQATLADFSSLHPVFDPHGVVTAGNASSINDGAAAVLVMTEEKAAELGIEPLVEIVDAAVAGVDPTIMGMGPVPAISKLLQRNHLSLAQIDCIELNEAFAAQALGCIRELGLDPAKVNPNGSGISIGHPVGCTGTMITIKLMNEMRRQNHTYGIATLCIGGGQGLAVLFKRWSKKT